MVSSLSRTTRPEGERAVGHEAVGLTTGEREWLKKLEAASDARYSAEGSGWSTEGASATHVPSFSSPSPTTPQ